MKFKVILEQENKKIKEKEIDVPENFEKDFVYDFDSFADTWIYYLSVYKEFKKQK